MNSRNYTLRKKIHNEVYKNNLFVKVADFSITYKDGYTQKYSGCFLSIENIAKFIKDNKNDPDVANIRCLDIITAFIDRDLYYKDDLYFKYDFSSIIINMIYQNRAI